MSDDEPRDNPGSDRASTETVSLDAAHRATKSEAVEPKAVKSEEPEKVSSGRPNPLVVVLGGVKRVPVAMVGLVRKASDELQERPRRALKVLGLVTLGLALLTGLVGYQALRYHQTVEARDQAILAAKDSVTQVLSYNYRTVDRQVADTQDMLTGKFKDDYANLLRDVITPTAKQTQVEIQSEVVNESVVYSKPDQVVLLLYVNQQSAAKNTGEDPILTGSRLRVSLLKDDGKWRISELTPV